MGSTFYIMVEREDIPAQAWQYGGLYIRGGTYIAAKYSRRRIETVRKQILKECLRGGSGVDPLRPAVLRHVVLTLQPGQKFRWVHGMTAWIEEVPDQPRGAPDGL